MAENDPGERNRFLAEMEEHLGRNELQVVLQRAGERLVERPGDLEARLALCRARLLQGDLDEAREMLNDAERIIGSLSRVYAEIGEICRNRGLQAEAEAYVAKFRALNSGAPPESGLSEWFAEPEAVGEPEAGGEREAGEPEEGAEVPPDFRTVTLAELYIRQGHLRQAQEVLERIAAAEPQNEKAAALLRETRERLGPDDAVSPAAGVIGELSQWLKNVERLRGRAT